MTILIRGAKVIDGSSPHHLDTVDIFIENGIVQSIGTKIEKKADTVIETEGLHISNGWTDIFADYREPGFEHKETIASGLASAAAGGFTAVLTVPNTNPTVSSKSVVQYILKQAEGNAVSVHPIGSISNNLEGKNLAEMLDMHTHGAVAFSDGWKPIQNANLMLKALEYAKAFDGTLIEIPCDATLSSGGLMHEGIESTQLGMPGIPSLAETLHLHRNIELLRYTDSKLHITGISCAESVEMIRNAKADGLKITCSVTPYHLVLNDEIMRSYNSAYKVMPPIRTKNDRKALVEGLKDGTIDCVAAHHRPQEWDAKAKEFEYASDGMNVQENTFAILYNSLKNEIPLERLVDALSQKPNGIFGVKSSSIKEAGEVNFTLFSTTDQTNLNGLKSKSANNPFMNKELAGKVIGILKGNQVILNK
ncbi:MAG: dihydroorotase [Chitinophagaceae bacterium]|jgi:dihydroorotase